MGRNAGRPRETGARAGISIIPGSRHEAKRANNSSGVINGGGSNPANPAQFSSYNVSSPYQATGCKQLNFQPKLHVRIYGPTSRAKSSISR